MYDQRLLGTHFNEPTILTGRFAGAGTSVPTAVAGVPDATNTNNTKITRNGVGNLTVQFLDTPLGTLQSYDFWVCSNNQHDLNVRTTPVAAGSYTFQLNVTLMSNGAATDVATGDELHFFIVAKRSGI